MEAVEGHATAIVDWNLVKGHGDRDTQIAQPGRKQPTAHTRARDNQTRANDFCYQARAATSSPHQEQGNQEKESHYQAADIYDGQCSRHNVACNLRGVNEVERTKHAKRGGRDYSAEKHGCTQPQ